MNGGKGGASEEGNVRLENGSDGACGLQNDR